MAGETESATTPVAEGHAVDAAAETPAGGADQHTTTTEHASSGGLPQFEFQHWAGQIGYMLILFAILYVLMSKLFVPRMRRILDERESTITGAVNSARQVQAEADAQAAAAKAEIDEGRAQARRVAAEAKAKAQAEMAERQAAEDARLQAELDKAEARIRATRDQAMANVGQIAADTAEAIVTKLTGVAPSRAEVDAALAGRTTEGAA